MAPSSTLGHPIGMNRRELLQVGYSALLGLGLPGLLAGRRETTALGSPAAFRPRPKSVILIFLGGAPSQLDMFDMKPEAPEGIRGEFKPISTRVPGVEFCEHMPKLAQAADKLAIIRSMTHGSREHFEATHMVLTGNRLPTGVDVNANLSRLDWPCYSAVVNYLRPRNDGISNGATVPCPLVEQNLVWPGQHAGFLGAKHDPWQLNFPGAIFNYVQLNFNTGEGAYHVGELQLPKGLDVKRLDNRRVLLGEVNQQQRELARLVESHGLASHQQQAFSMLTSGHMVRAIDLEQEPARVRERYGMHSFGQSLLLARRLIEAGVPIVQTNMGVAQTWDTHKDNFRRLKTLMPHLDSGVSALIEDLKQRGMLDDTLVVMLGEFGRTPRVGEGTTSGSTSNGRDHWGGVFFSVFAGGGVHGGQVIGRSDKIAAYPVTRGYYPADVAATIYTALGIDLATEVHDALGRPLRLNQGSVIEPLYAGRGE